LSASSTTEDSATRSSLGTLCHPTQPQERRIRKAAEERVRVHGTRAEAIPKVAVAIQFEAVLGKTRRTEF
jgi:hypothetical protein